MLSIPPPKYPKRPSRAKSKRVAPPTPAGPVLSAASYSAETSRVFLTFDGYDLSIDAIDPNAITLNDPATSTLYWGESADLSGTSVVVVHLTEIDFSSGDQTVLNASGASGIVDADTGMAWAGCTDLVLPFP